MHLQKQKKRTISTFTVAAKVTLQEGAQADQMIIGRNQGQHHGISRTTEQVIQLVKTVFSIKPETLVTKQGLMKNLIGNTHLIIIILRLLH